jgi:HJR/Mrr/RecB family endonuclease
MEVEAAAAEAELARHRQTATVRELYLMTPRQFEVGVAAVLERSRYKVQLTPSTCDFGADLVATRHGMKTIVGVKQHQQPVGAQVVHRVLGSIQYGPGNGGFSGGIHAGGITRGA